MTRSTSINKFKRLAVAAFVGLPLVAFSLTACASDGGGNGGGEPAEGVQEIRPEVQALLTDDMKGSLADKLPASFKDADALMMVTDATIGVPVASFDDDNELIEGFAVDMSQAIGWVLGKDVSINHSVWDGLIPGIESGRYDFSISVMLDTDTRQEKVDFVDYLMDGSSILVAADSDFDNLTVATLCGLRVGVMRGSYEEGLVTEQNEKCDDAIEIQVFGGLNEGMLAVQSGRSDVLMGAASQLSYVATISNGKLRNAGEVVDPGIDGIAIAKNSELVPAIYAAMKELKDNGVYEQILKLSGVEENALPEITINRKSV